MRTHALAITALGLATMAQAQPYTYQLGDASVSGDVEWSALGKVNWKEYLSGSSPWFPGGSLSSFFSALPASDKPIMSPYGDILAYTAAGVGDVDGDGYGDFAVTWYEADKDRGDPCGNHPIAWDLDTSNNPTGTVVRDNNNMERIGFVRIMSGDPDGGTSGAGTDCMDIDAATGNVDTLNVNAGVLENNLRRIGAPFSSPAHPHDHSDFWGTGHNALWSHEITTVGDIDGDGNDDVMIAANVGQAGVVEIWAYSDRYNKTTLTSPRWVKLIEITGTNDSTMQEEFAYQSYEGPPPNASNVSFGRDFNNDGQPDLAIASKFYRDQSMGHVVNATASGSTPSARNAAPGAVWLYMLPKSDVFDEIDRVSATACDAEHNRDGSAGADNITDHLPLELTTEEYNVRIVGHQRWQSGEGLTYYPRHFGYELTPAGDIDNDGELDLAVSAPYHYEQGVYQNYEDNTADLSDYQTGRLYFFLSDSDTRSDSTTFAELLPKHYYSNTGAIQLIKCGSSMYSYYIKSRNMTNQQISFESDEADYVMEGAHPAGDLGTAPFAGSFAGGVKLNGGSDTDPDLAVYHNMRNRIYVFKDIRSIVSGYIATYGKPTSTKTMWSTDTSTWPSSQPTVVFEDSDVFQIASGTNGTEAGVTVKGVRSFDNQYDFDGDMVADSVNYPGVNGVRIGGDLDGDGDCELFVSCQAAWSSSWTRLSTLAVDVTTTASLIELHAEYLPESFAWEDPDMMVHPKYNQSNQFNEGTTIVRTFALAAWPVWNPGSQDDALLGVRYFPRRIEKFPDANRLNWISIPSPGGSFTGEAYDKMTIVPAGKAYLVRSN